MAMADYALCEYCDGKVLYHPDEIPDGAFVAHRSCHAAYCIAGGADPATGAAGGES